MRNLLLAFLLLSSLFLSAQEPKFVIEWEDIRGGSYPDGFTTVVELENKDIFVAGYFRTENQNDDGEYWLARYDATGKSIWQEVYPGRHGERVLDVIVMKDGGFVILGGVKGPSGPYNRLFKVDGSGMMQWSQTINQAEPYVLHKMEAIEGEGFVLVGEIKQRGQLMTWLYKTDEQGNYLSDETFKKRNTPNNIQDFYRDEDGSLYLVGEAFPKDGESVMQTMHIRPNGRLGWVEYFPSAYTGFKIVELDDASLLLGGYGYDEDSTGTLDHNPKLFRLSKQGKLMWEQSMAQEASAEERLFDIMPTKEGSILVALEGRQDKEKPISSWFVEMDYGGKVLAEMFVKPKTQFRTGDMLLIGEKRWLMVGNIPESYERRKNLDAYIGLWRYKKSY